MSLIAIIQARMTSSRYPGKVLAPLAGVPLIARVIDRVRAGLPYNTPLYLATTTNQADDPLANYCERLCRVFRGDEANVTERFFQCALEAKAKHIARFTGDTPLLDATLIRSTLGDYFEHAGSDDYHGFSNNAWIQNCADGVDHEVFSFAALEQARAKATSEEREHVTLYVRRNMRVMEYPSLGFEDVHFSVNDLSDLKHCEQLIAECGESAPYRIYAEASRRLRSQDVPKEIIAPRPSGKPAKGIAK